VRGAIFSGKFKQMEEKSNSRNFVFVPYRHGGGWSKKINAWYLNTLMVYL
jgi:hypothetical protein